MAKPYSLGAAVGTENGNGEITPRPSSIRRMNAVDGASWFWRYLLQNKRPRKLSSPIPTTPPITPPAMAPASEDPGGPAGSVVELEAGADVRETDCVNEELSDTVLWILVAVDSGPYESCSPPKSRGCYGMTYHYRPLAR